MEHETVTFDDGAAAVVEYHDGEATVVETRSPIADDARTSDAIHIKLTDEHIETLHERDVVVVEHDGYTIAFNGGLWQNDAPSNTDARPKATEGTAKRLDKGERVLWGTVLDDRAVIAEAVGAYNKQNGRDRVLHH